MWTRHVTSWEMSFSLHSAGGFTQQEAIQSEGLVNEPPCGKPSEM